MADAAEHEAAVSPACFYLRKRRDVGEKPSRSFALRGLLQKKPFWCCFPSPGVQPAGVVGLCLAGGWGRHTDALWSSVCPPGNRVLPLLSRQRGQDECKQEQPGRSCVVCCARSLRARAAQQGNEVVLQLVGM